MRAPVLTPLPWKVAAVEVKAGGHQVGASLIEQPVRLRLPSAEPRRRIEAIEHALPIQKQQPILRTTLRAEEQQRQLVGREQVLVEEAKRDLPVALGQMPRQLEHVLGAHAPSTPLHRTRVTIAPSLSDFPTR